MLNENNQFAVLLPLNGAEFFGVDFLAFFISDQIEALVALFDTLFRSRLRHNHYPIYLSLEKC
jgi:hypothetical protein